MPTKKATTPLKQLTREERRKYVRRLARLGADFGIVSNEVRAGVALTRDIDAMAAEAALLCTIVTDGVAQEETDAGE